MSSALETLHWISGLIVLAEALNKLERSSPLSSGVSPCQRLLISVKALGWTLLALGAGGAVATPVLLAMGVAPGNQLPLLRLERPTLAEVSVLVGFACLVLRTRIKEGCDLSHKRRIGDQV